MKDALEKIYLERTPGLCILIATSTIWPVMSLIPYTVISHRDTEKSRKRGNKFILFFSLALCAIFPFHHRQYRSNAHMLADFVQHFHQPLYNAFGYIIFLFRVLRYFFFTGKADG